MFLYFLKVTICWLIFYMGYSKFLSKETFFKTNRWYLLGTLLLGAGIPLLEFLPIFQEGNPVVIYFQPISEGSFYVQSAVNEAVTNTFFDWENFFIGLYIIGVTIFSIRFFIGLGKIYALFRESEIIKKENHTLVLTNQPHLPFSFFTYIFWSKDLEVNDADGQKIVTHEEAHVKGWHSADVIFLEIFSIMFWVSPMVYFYKKSLKTVHEYLADSVVLQTTPTKKYGHLLLRQSQSGLQVALANHFFHSQLKQRIVMMTRSKSRKEAIVKYLFALPVILLLLIAFSKKEAMANNDNLPSENIETSNFENLNSISDSEKKGNGEVDEMPRFSGCEDKKEIKNRDACSKKELMKFIYSNVKYPKTASKAGIQGKVIISFLVQKDGTIGNAKIKKDIGGGCGKEALRVINAMPNWIPGTKDGKAIDVKMTLPVQFKLSGESQSNTSTHLEELLKEENVVFKIDGNTVNLAEIKALLPDEIATLDVYAAIKTEEEEGKKKLEKKIKIVSIKTKGYQPIKFEGDDVSYFIDGNRVNKKEVDNLPLEKIATRKESEAIVTKNSVAKKVYMIKVTTKDGDDNSEEIYKVVEEMPRFKNEDCEKMEDQQAQKKCSEMAMLKFIYSNVKYPKAARDAGIQGRVIIKFTVQKDGSIADAKVLRDPGGGCGEEAERVVNAMPNFVPGKQKREAVNVSYTLPVSFKLAEPNSSLKVEDNNIKRNKDMKPLFIVDGVEFDKSATGELKPDDIATINILKGEKAIAKYGEKGKYGVVEITLKGRDSTRDELKVRPVKKRNTLKSLGISYLKISPNPSSGFINIEYEAEEELMEIIGYDIFGKVLFKYEEYGGKRTISNINIKNAAKGMIIVAFRKGENIYTEKVTLQ